MEVKQEPRGSSLDSRGSRYCDPTKAGTKRLFSNRSRESDRESDHGEYEIEDEEEQLHSGKRRRPTDWPLKATNTDSPPARAPLRSRNVPNSPSHRRTSSSQARLSKFLEGSMNDRVSHKPPTTYIGDEEFRDRFDEADNRDTPGRKMARPKTFTHHPNTSIVGTDASGVSRHSGIFRFGKSLAASFNPSNWKIFSKPIEEIQEIAQEKILRERREKAESMYQELKKSGHFRDSNFHPSLFQQQQEEKNEAMPTKHDSGVEFGERRSTSRMSTETSKEEKRRARSTSCMSAETSREEKRMGRVFLDPPPIPTSAESHFSQSPASTSQDSTRKAKAKFHFKKPSLSNIRKSMSDNDSTVTNTGDYHQARRVPSRKDLQKQQKLVKRVSDLEGKLEAAKRQLAEVQNEPVPSGPPLRMGRTRFVPGAMPSLPSERLLSTWGQSEVEMSESMSISQIGKAVTIDEPARRAPSPPMLGKSLHQEPETALHDRVIQSVEVKVEEEGGEESLQFEEVSTEERPIVQSVKSRQVQITAATTSTNSDSQDSIGSFFLSDLEVDSDYQASSPGKHETSPEPSELSPSDLQPTKSTTPAGESPESKSSKTKSKKRKSMADEKTYKPTQEAESDLSIKLHRTPKNAPPRKLQKTTASTPPTKKPSPQSQKTGDPRHRQMTPGKHAKKVVMPARSCSVKSKIPVKGGRRSVSPPPSSPFTGLEYVKPSSQPQEAKMAAYGAIPSVDGDDEVPPLPEMPKAIRLASGEVVNIPVQKSSIGSPKRKGGSGISRGGSKLTKARPSVSPKKEKGGEDRKSGGKKEDFEWPEDVF